MTEDYVNVLIDHILVSAKLPIVDGSYKIWNPFQDDDAETIRKDLLDASDHFPVTLDINL